MKSRKGSQSKSLGPHGLPVYRLLTGPDDTIFCERVSEAITLGYELFGSPSITYNGKNVIAAQALIWPRKKTKEKI